MAYKSAKTLFLEQKLQEAYLEDEQKELESQKSSELDTILAASSTFHPVHVEGLASFTVREGATYECQNVIAVCIKTGVASGMTDQEHLTIVGMMGTDGRITPTGGTT